MTMLSYEGELAKAFRDKLVIGKAYKIKVAGGKDDRSAEFIRAVLIAKYPTYAVFDTGNYLEDILYFDLANGGLK